MAAWTIEYFGGIPLSPADGVENERTVGGDVETNNGRECKSPGAKPIQGIQMSPSWTASPLMQQLPSEKEPTIASNYPQYKRQQTDPKRFLTGNKRRLGRVNNNAKALQVVCQEVVHPQPQSAVFGHVGDDDGDDEDEQYHMPNAEPKVVDGDTLCQGDGDFDDVDLEECTHPIGFTQPSMSQGLKTEQWNKFSKPLPPAPLSHASRVAGDVFLTTENIKGQSKATINRIRGSVQAALFPPNLVKKSRKSETLDEAERSGAPQGSKHKVRNRFNSASKRKLYILAGTAIMVCATSISLAVAYSVVNSN